MADEGAGDIRSSCYVLSGCVIGRDRKLVWVCLMARGTHPVVFALLLAVLRVAVDCMAKCGL